MKKHLSFGMIMLLTMVLAACGGSTASNQTSSSSSKESISSKSSKSSTSKAPTKKVEDLSISLGNDGDKAYITVRGKQVNYTAEEFKWAWGLKEQDSSKFGDGKAIPEASDFQPVSFNDNNEFTVRYCLTDITTITAGTLYRIYGGTPETYGDIPFASNMFGANDASRKYYLRQDQDNSLVYENIQPLTYTKASVVEIVEGDLPEGVVNAGAYLKFGGVNSKGLTIEMIKAWDDAGYIAGNFQCVIPSWNTHQHSSDERFYTIEEGYVYFYLYVGFIGEGEGWMTHFDLVSGNAGTGLQTSTTFNGETPYVINGATYKIYSDTNKSGEENYWGCLGVYREAAQ